MSGVTVCILYQGWSRFSCASRRLCSLPASWNQSCLPLQGTRMFFFKAPAPARILPLPNSLFLKLQYCAPGQRIFSRHHWSVCSSVVPTLSHLVSLCLSAVPCLLWGRGYQLHFIEPGGLCSHALLSD